MSIQILDHLADAREALRHHPLEQRVRARLEGAVAVDSRRAVLLWEPRRVVPIYAVPQDDIHAGLAPGGPVEDPPPGVLHPGVPFAAHTAPGEPVSIGGRAGAGFRLADPDLPGYVALDFRAFDAWLEEEEPVVGHPRDPFHRVDVRLSSRPVRVEFEGAVLAETTRARMLFETGLPVRYYLPREDVHGELVSTDAKTYCPYKGEASYWTLGEHEDIAWSYEDPLPDLPMVKGLVSFWNERVDVIVDGQARGRPHGAVADALRHEFGLK